MTIDPIFFLNAGIVGLALLGAVFAAAWILALVTASKESFFSDERKRIDAITELNLGRRKRWVK